jgi:hypothetical protein
MILTIDMVLHQTAKAVLISFGDEEVWIPFSVIEPESLVNLEEATEMDVADWFVKKEGLECYED